MKKIAVLTSKSNNILEYSICNLETYINIYKVLKWKIPFNNNKEPRFFYKSN